jgi:hypothetical protein
MSDNEEITLAEIEQAKPKVLMIGAAVGLAVGVLGAYMLLQRAEKEQRAPELNVMEGIKLGVLVFGLLRSVSQL